MNKKKKLLFALSALVLGGNTLASEVAEYESSLPVGIYHFGDKGMNDKSLVEVNYTAGGTSIRYMSYAASAMKTLGTGTYEKDYQGAGCVADSQDAAAGMNLDDTLDIPQGSKIVSVSFLTYDISNTRSTSGYLYAYSGGSATTVATGTSGNTFDAGYVSTGGFYDHITDVNSLYGLRLSGPAANGDLRLCGVRIGYIPEDLVDDVIYASNFFR
jgi:hypothetical protein